VSYPDDYKEKQPRGYPSGNPLKDEDSPTMIAQSQPRQIFTLTATQASQQPIGVSYPEGYKEKNNPRGYPLGRPLKDGDLPTMTALKLA